jgi:hypothetical protein
MAPTPPPTLLFTITMVVQVTILTVVGVVATTRLVLPIPATTTTPSLDHTLMTTGLAARCVFGRVTPPTYVGTCLTKSMYQSQNLLLLHPLHMGMIPACTLTPAQPIISPTGSIN